MSRSITRRLLASNLLVLAGFLGLAGVALDRAYRNSVETAARNQLQAHVYTLLSAASEDERGRMRLPEHIAAPAFNRTDSGLYAEVGGEDGRYHWRSASLLGHGEGLLTRRRPGETDFRVAGDLALFDQGIAWEDDYGDPIPYSITVAMDKRSLQAQQDDFRNTLWGWLGGVAAMLLLVQLLLARWGLGPLREMGQALRRIEAGEARRIEGPVASELKGLTDNLNALIEQNRLRQERVRNSLADLAHSMKTPLAVLRGAAGQSEDAVLRRQVDEQTERIDQMVSYQRQRAAVAGTVAITRPVTLAPIIGRLCAGLDKVHHDRGLAHELQVPAEIAVGADQGDLFELFGNLLENAYRHCRARVRVSATVTDGELAVDIEDDGAGFTRADIPRLLKRGERADQVHRGEGIGLAVANEIVAQYQGRLEIRESALGGADVRIRIPTGQPG